MNPVAIYHYKARGHHGQVMEGTMEADNANSVATKLQDGGLIPIHIDIARNQRPSAATASPALNFFQPRVSEIDLIQFSRQMASLSKAGVPILSALGGLAESSENPTLRSVIREITTKLEGGHDLASSLSLHTNIFSRFYIAMIRIGETTGKLEEVFHQLVRYLERDRQTSRQIKSALRYPSFVITAIVAAIAIINLFVIPSFAHVFQQFGAELPLETRILLASSNFTIAHWPVMLGSMVAGIAGLRMSLRQPKGRRIWDRYKLKLPLVGTIIHRATLARFARMFAMALSAGVPIAQALTVVARALENRYLEEKILAMRGDLERGESVTLAATRSGVFNALVLQMMSVGEETGAIDTLLAEVAEFYEEEVDQDIERLSARIEPILTVIIAGIVLVLALGVFLPMWSLAEVTIKK